MKTRNFWLTFAAIIMFLSFTGCTCYNHYKVYKVDDQKIYKKVWLQDQFNKKPIEVTVVSLTHFANPVRKNSSKIHDKNAHLTWYNIKYESNQPFRIVTFKNQFGTQTWKLASPVLLAVPTEKFEKDSKMSKKLDHYLAYKVISEDSLQIKVELEDQFDKRLKRKESKVVVKPMYFCNPVQKNKEPIKDQKKGNHLACYQFIPVEKEPRPINVDVQDQFGQKSLVVKNSFMLCVPSTKQRFKIVNE
jgi:hypothetical protein